MSYRQLKWMILIVPTLLIGIWEYVRHQFLMPYLSMDTGNYLTPVLLFMISVTLQYKWFRKLESMQEELQKERSLKASWEEREQLARELHDGIAQSLFLLSVKVDRAEKRQNSSGEVADLNELRTTIQDVNRYVRQAISDLKLPPDIDAEGNHLSFPERIQQIADEYQLGLHLAWTLSEERWSAKEKLELLACIREAIVNASKHAAVQDIFVQGREQEGAFQVSIIDRGNGFKVGELSPERYGLRIIKQRAEQMHWSLTVESMSGETCIMIQGGQENYENPRIGR
ncbi:sensor histidine kinase [Paenibacillus lutimineralis]|uniref:histidine kinase n=1 Tax=Paenibacillus lutimineralis TaxID=2707005 RepID=A0A3S9V0U1_9BACL|nr:histidine kinase [Paenibacillus lutimineralis]AZS15967.1 two-component sensor histidine kinase [Paenibacillus lutimineralis]